MTKLVHRLGLPGTIALAVIVLFVLVAILAPWIAPYPLQGAGAPNVIAKLQPPSASYWLGTDHLGRDILSLYHLRRPRLAGQRPPDRRLLVADRPAGRAGRRLFRRLDR